MARYQIDPINNTFNNAHVYYLFMKQNVLKSKCKLQDEAACYLRHVHCSDHSADVIYHEKPGTKECDVSKSESCCESSYLKPIRTNISDQVEYFGSKCSSGKSIRIQQSHYE